MADEVHDSGDDSNASGVPPPPPGFEGVKPGTHADGDNGAGSAAVAELADRVAGADVQEEVPDEPDLSLKTGRLHEEIEDSQIKKIIGDGDTPYVSARTFEELGLSAELLQGLYTEMKFERPSKIQAETLPMILTPPFRNLVAQAHNGSGKTTCFVLGMLSRVDPRVRKPQALCICPTRELVLQNVAVLSKMGKYTGIECAHTATEIKGRQPPLSAQVVIGTPGRMINWIAHKTLPAKDVKLLVFDEADEMLAQDGFGQDSLKIFKSVFQNNPQILLFSATFSDVVRAFAERLVGPKGNKVYVPKENLSLEVIKQYRVECPTLADKDKVLKDVIFPACEKLGQAIIFVRTRKGANALHGAMEAGGHKCTSIEGGMQHEDRDRVVQEFREGKTKILISTDVLARGFDHSSVTLVINYDPPVDRDGRPAFETYMHRIGRSGRFGRKGAAFNFVCGRQDAAVVDAISTHFQHPIPAVPYDDEDKFEEVLQSAGLA